MACFQPVSLKPGLQHTQRYTSVNHWVYEWLYCVPCVVPGVPASSRMKWVFVVVTGAAVQQAELNLARALRQSFCYTQHSHMTHLRLVYGVQSSTDFKWGIITVLVLLISLLNLKPGTRSQQVSQKIFQEVNSCEMNTTWTAYYLQGNVTSKTAL